MALCRIFILGLSIFVFTNAIATENSGESEKVEWEEFRFGPEFNFQKNPEFIFSFNKYFYLLGASVSVAALLLLADAWYYLPPLVPFVFYFSKNIKPEKPKDLMDRWSAYLQRYSRRNQEIAKFDSFEHRYSYRYEYTEGWDWYYKDWSFRLSLDAGVVEVTATPSTVKQLLDLETDLQKDIFDTAAAVGLKVFRAWDVLNAGHVNIGFFLGSDSHRKMLKFFIIDFFNHAELAMGILINDPLTARMPMKSRIFRKKLKDFLESKSPNYEELLFFLKELYSKATWHRFLSAGLSTNSHDQALNIDSLFLGSSLFERRLEIRSVRGQRNIREFILVAELFEARLNYLNTLAQSPSLNSRKPVKKMRDKILAFKDYVTEAGLEWSKYRVLMPKRYQRYEERTLLQKKRLFGLGENCEQRFYPQF